MDNDTVYRIDRVFDMILFNSQKYRKWIMDDIKCEIQKGDRHFKEIDSIIYADMRGALDIIDRCGIDNKEYVNTLQNIRSDKKSDTPCNLNVEGEIYTMNMDTLDTDEEKWESANYSESVRNYIRSVLMGISTCGISLSQDQLDDLTDKSKQTLTGSFNVFNESVEDGNFRSCDNIPKVYDYVNSTDPEITRRMIYDFEHEIDELIDHIDRYKYMDFEEIHKMLTQHFKKIKKKKNRYKKFKKNKKEEKNRYKK